ncbi:Ankyrin repeat family A protein 2 [Sciurus carolinensis]|uniref:Ankyrin repeat family A protein 2 n=1 Tax=Sciurus carolinensis TaxID=30640 RepID=A0AA41SUD7_SCICA|nr:Ankyrin repeat family A protein 2 [Sciurus carolinensis]
MNHRMMNMYHTDVHEAFYGIVSALSVHQLAAQGEMLYLATRIEQENVINHTDEEGFTPLMWAAAHGQIAVVEFLLQNGADPQLLGKGRESALSLACSKGYTDIVKMLLDCGVDVNEYDWEGSYEGPKGPQVQGCSGTWGEYSSPTNL